MCDDKFRASVSPLPFVIPLIIILKLNKIKERRALVPSGRLPKYYLNTQALFEANFNFSVSIGSDITRASVFLLNSLLSRTNFLYSKLTTSSRKVASGVFLKSKTEVMQIRLYLKDFIQMALPMK